MDVGAASHGELTEPYAALLLARCAEVVGFEPDEAECANVQKAYELRGWPSQFHPYYIGDGTQRVFHVTSWGQTASLYKPNESLLGNYQNLLELTRLQRTMRVETVALDTLRCPCDLLKIDVQGAELDVLQHAQYTLKQALMVWLEVEFLPLYQEQPLFADVDGFMRSQGFSFFTFDYFGSRLLRDAPHKVPQLRTQQLWADVIYIRPIASWSQMTTLELKKLAALLEMIGAGDHVAAVLRILQARGIDIVGDYLRRYYAVGAIRL
ncbi:FkbM family methyltransferase [Tepidimonas sp. HKU79]|uniref:FkbM family methyltransferase n=1 Tax=Tepidimonas sp. HKU79 TaxID=3414505 RepID=UPI003C7A707E